MTDIDAMLAERDARYGDFTGHAEVAQRTKLLWTSALRRRGKALAPDQAEALDMIAHKIARIINGDPDYSDNWQDIAGYARLVAARLESEAK